MRQDNATLQEEGVSLGKWFLMKRLETLQCFGKVLRASVAIASLTVTIPWPLRGLFINRFYSNLSVRFLIYLSSKLKVLLKGGLKMW